MLHHLIKQLINLNKTFGLFREYQTTHILPEKSRIS